MPRVSQRKLFRVVKWKDIPNEGYQKKKFKKDGIENTEGHEFVLLTDSEEYVKENIQVLEGVHHLSDSQNLYKSQRHEQLMQYTSAEKKI